jgi:hypothetical protein
MGISVKGRTALSVLRFRPGSLDGLVPAELASRIAPTPEYGSFKPRPDANEDGVADIIVALARGYEMDPALFDGWDGIGMGSLVTHASDERGPDHILHSLFGMARGLEDIIQVRSFSQVAGAARLAVYGAQTDWIAPGLNQSYPKFDPTLTPPRNTCPDLALYFLQQKYPRFKNLLSLLEDISVPERYAAVQSLAAFGSVGDWTYTAVVATQEGLPLGRLLQIWAITKNPEHALEALRSGMPDEYIQATFGSDEVPGW